MKRSTIVVAAIIVAGVLAGCRGEEERPLVLDKGAYTGGGTTPLTEAQVSALNSRAMMQAEGNTTGGGGISTVVPGPGTAPPPTANEKALNQRLRQQQ